MMNSRLESLQSFGSATELKAQLRTICSDFGCVTRLEVLVAKQVGKRRALCFLRMATAGQEQAVMRELQLGRFGGDLVVIVDLKNEMQPDREFLTASRPRQAGHGEFQPTLPLAAFIKPSRLLPQLGTGFSDSLLRFDHA